MPPWFSPPPIPTIDYFFYLFFFAIIDLSSGTVPTWCINIQLRYSLSIVFCEPIPWYFGGADGKHDENRVLKRNPRDPWLESGSSSKKINWTETRKTHEKDRRKTSFFILFFLVPVLTDFLSETRYEWLELAVYQPNNSPNVALEQLCWRI